MIYKIFFLFFLIVLSAVFSASEVALITLTPSKVRELRAKKRRGIVAVEALKKNPQRLLITILIGNNLVNIMASVYATVFFTEIFGSSGVGIAVGVMTFLLLVFGEITPKSLAQLHHVRFALFIGRFIIILSYVFEPIIWLLEKLLMVTNKIAGSSKIRRTSMTEDELKAMVILGEEEGSLEKQEKEFIENVLEFNDITVQEVMTQRVEIQALNAETTVRNAAHFVANNTHSRFPVYQNTIDNIIGILSVKEILDQMAQKSFDKTLADITLLPVVQVPTTKKINQLFQEFQKKRKHMAVVIDEHGATVGIVTLEDLLEEIVGEIVDEYDIEEELISKIDAKTFLVKGKTPVYELNDLLRVSIDIVPDYKPLSFLILEKLHRFPKKGESFTLKGLRFTIKEMSKKRIEFVEVKKR